MRDKMLDANVSEIISHFNIDPFIGLETEWLQQKQFCSKFDKIKPRPIKFGERNIVLSSGKVKKVTAEGYYVPFEQSLRCLIQITEV